MPLYSRPGESTEWVLSCDAFLDGVHFLAKSYPAGFGWV